MHDPYRLVTVASFSHPLQAWIARNRLADNGIPAFVQDEHVVTMYWLYAFAIQGVKVQVPEGDAELAAEILAARCQPPGAREAGEDTSQGDLQCNLCKSHHVARERYSRPAVYLSWLLLGTPLPILRDGWMCFRCGHRDRSPLFDKAFPRPFTLRSMIIWSLVVACVLALVRASGCVVSTTGTTTTNQTR